jgi:hypothetical protein
MTKYDKLSQIALAAAVPDQDRLSIDLPFAAETARHMKSPVFRTQTQQAVSLVASGSIKKKIETDNYYDFNDYAEIVMGAFYIGAGRSSYFGDHGEYNYVRLPSAYRLGIDKRDDKLDPIKHGGMALDAFRGNRGVYWELLELIQDESPTNPATDLVARGAET